LRDCFSRLSLTSAPLWPADFFCPGTSAISSPTDNPCVPAIAPPSHTGLAIPIGRSMLHPALSFVRSNASSASRLAIVAHRLCGYDGIQFSGHPSSLLGNGISPFPFNQRSMETNLLLSRGQATISDRLLSGNAGLKPPSTGLCAPEGRDSFIETKLTP